MTSNIEKKTVSGRELIALIREAYAFRDPVFISAHNISISVEIANFDDDDARAVNTERTIEIVLPSLVSKIEIDDQIINLEIVSKRFKIQMQTKVVDRTDGFFKLLVPSTATVDNVRKTERISLKDQGFYDGILSFSGKIIPCLIQFIDLNSDTLGARLLVDTKLDENDSNIFLNTRVQTEDFEFSKQARLTRVQLIKSGISYFEYVVGLKSNELNVLDEKLARAKRFELKMSMHCTVPSTNSRIVFDVNDLSASGFKATKCTPNLPWISQGIAIIEDTTGIKFSIVRKDEDGSFGVKIIGDRHEDRIKWSNFVLPIISAGRVSASAHDARALINTFLEAGGGLVDNLTYKRNSTLEKQSLNFLTKQTDLMFRWVNINETGGILGHHSAYRIGSNSWFTGDIVGAQSKEKRLDADFIRKNFQTFGDALIAMSEPQIVVGGWTFGHAYWRKFREYLISNNYLIVLEKYDHIPRNNLNLNISDDLLKSIKFEQLLSGSYLAFNEILSGVNTSSYLKILGALDITSTGLFINATSAVYKNEGMKGFRREPFHFEYKGNSFIGVLSQLPGGTTINGVFDCIFLFPSDKNLSLSLSDRNVLYSLVTIYGLSRGFRVNSLRSFINSDDAVGVHSEFVIFIPEGLGYYYK